MNTPKLRFKEFSGEWLDNKLGYLSDVRDGTHDSPKYQTNGYPFITSKNLTKDGELDFSNVSYISENDFNNFNKRSLVELNDILFGMIGTIGNPVLIRKSGFAIKNVALIKQKNNLLNEYLIHYLRSQNIINQFNRENVGGTQKFLSLSIIRDLKIFYPNILEQQKIASFFTAVDQKLTALKKKKELLEQYKKGVMQQIFSQKLRFKDDAGNPFLEWEEKKLGEVLVSISTKKHQIKSTEISETGNYRVVDQGQDSIAGYYNDGNKKFTDFPVIVFGDHTTILKYVDFEFIVGADGTKLLKNKNNDNLKFLYYNLTFNNVKQEGYKRHFTMLSEKYLQIPSSKEQQKIADFLSAIDSKINAVQQQIEKTEQWKKGLLQQMFV